MTIFILFCSNSINALSFNFDIGSVLCWSMCSSLHDNFCLTVDESSEFDALQTLADLSLMMPETTADTGELSILLSGPYITLFYCHVLLAIFKFQFKLWILLLLLPFS